MDHILVLRIAIVVITGVGIGLHPFDKNWLRTACMVPLFLQYLYLTAERLELVK